MDEVRERIDVLERLRKIEGQVRGIQRMIEDERQCVEILNQITAIRAALNRVGLRILEKHTRGSVAQAIRNGEGDQAIGDVMRVLLKFLG